MERINTEKKLTSESPDKYTFVEKCGEGGMKRVLKMNDKDTSRNVAMALLKEEELTKENYNEFVNEAKITAHLEHPNIVPIHDISVNEVGQPYFTMKLLRGGTLADILCGIAKKDKKYTEKYTLNDLLRIFNKVCDALDFAHSNGIIHLDIKPSNIHVGDYGEVLLMDWGLAKTIDLEKNNNKDEALDSNINPSSIHIHIETAEATLDGDIKGTPGYMPPEQAAGFNKMKDIRSDIYALGATLYHILALRPPLVQTENSVDAIRKVLMDTINSEIVPPSQKNSTRYIPKALDAVVMKAMSNVRDNRYQSAREFSNDIEKYLDGFATSAEDATHATKTYLMIKRNKWATVAIIILCFSIIITFGMNLFNNWKQNAAWGNVRYIMPLDKEDFNKNWWQKKGDWEFKDDSIIATGNKNEPYEILYKNAFSGTIALEFDAEIISDSSDNSNGDLSAIISSNNDGTERYYLQVGGVQNRSAIIQKTKGFYASKEFTLEKNRTYHFRFEKEKQFLRIFCDGEKIIETKDIFYLLGGRIGIYTFGGGKKFSNIKWYQKGVPELVSPLEIGDSFYREAKRAYGLNKQSLFSLASDSYTDIINSHPNKILEIDAMLRCAYVAIETGDLQSAKRNSDYINKHIESVEQLHLKGEVEFQMGNLNEAYKTFAYLLEKFPESAIYINSYLIGKMSPNIAKKMNNELLSSFWSLIVRYQNSSVFRCKDKNLKNLNFLTNRDYELLDCSNNKIISLKPINKMRKLEHLDCADNNIVSLHDIKDFKLKTLECHNNQIKDISSINGENLKNLSLHGNNSIDLTPLLKCKKLERLTIPRYCKNINILKELPNLKYLDYDLGTNKTVEEFFQNL